MKVVILQPGYFPWLGFFNMARAADLFIYHTDVQYDKQSWRNRNRIRSNAAQGWSWLTVPVLIRSHSHDLIKDIRIDNSKKWGAKHLNLIRQNYANAPYLENYLGFFEELYSKRWDFLLDLDVSSTDYILKELGIDTPMDHSTNYELDGLKAQDRVIELCRQAGATEYINGPAGRSLYTETDFENAGIRLTWHEYTHPAYRQQYPGFIPYMSVIDLLFNHGPESLDIITGDSMLMAEAE